MIVVPVRWMEHLKFERIRLMKGRGACSAVSILKKKLANLFSILTRVA